MTEMFHMNNSCLRLLIFNYTYKFNYIYLFFFFIQYTVCVKLTLIFAAMFFDFFGKTIGSCVSAPLTHYSHFSTSF